VAVVEGEAGREGGEGVARVAAQSAAEKVAVVLGAVRVAAAMEAPWVVAVAPWAAAATAMVLLEEAGGVATAVAWGTRERSQQPRTQAVATRAQG
jgi:ribosomal protein L18E